MRLIGIFMVRAENETMHGGEPLRRITLEAVENAAFIESRLRVCSPEPDEVGRHRLYGSGTGRIGRRRTLRQVE